MKAKVALLGVALSLVALGVTSSLSQAHPRIARPAKRVVVVKKAPVPVTKIAVVVKPRPTYVWIAGHYEWKPLRGRWVWIPGHWAKR